jgi:hypothetical protein
MSSNGQAFGAFELPLILFRTPPGLELLLRQEGVPYETVGGLNPLTIRAGRFILFDGRETSPRMVRGAIGRANVAIDVNPLREKEAYDPFAAIVDRRADLLAWDIDDAGELRIRERVGRFPKAWIRRCLIDGLREAVTAAGGVWIRLSPYPFPYRSAFNLRIDLDEAAPDEYRRFALARRPLEPWCTYFASTRAYGPLRDVLDDLRSFDTQSHGHFHVVYRDPEANRRNLFRADRILREAGFEPTGFAAPHGRWNPGLDAVLEDLEYAFSSDFQLGHDDLPFFPWLGDRFSRVLQVPIHPVCEGVFFEAGCRDEERIASYFAKVVAGKIARGEPAFIYGHPEGRLARLPSLFRRVADVIEGQPLLWRTTLRDYASWWRWRASRRWTVRRRDATRVEIQFDEWDDAYPLGLEIRVGRFSSLIPATAARQVLRLDDLAFERGVSPEAFPDPPRRVGERPTFKQTLREAIGWETVTPVEELPARSLADRLKRHLRRWKEAAALSAGRAELSSVSDPEQGRS